MVKRKACVELPLASELAGNVEREENGTEGLAYRLLPAISGVGKLEAQITFVLTTPSWDRKLWNPMGVAEQGGGKSEGK